MLENLGETIFWWTKGGRRNDTGVHWYYLRGNEESKVVC